MKSRPRHIKTHESNSLETSTASNNSMLGKNNNHKRPREEGVSPDNKRPKTDGTETFVPPIYQFCKKQTETEQRNNKPIKNKILAILESLSSQEAIIFLSTFLECDWNLYLRFFKKEINDMTSMTDLLEKLTFSVFHKKLGEIQNAEMTEDNVAKLEVLNKLHPIFVPPISTQHTGIAFDFSQSGLGRKTFIQQTDQIPYTQLAFSDNPISETTGPSSQSLPMINTIPPEKSKDAKEETAENINNEGLLNSSTALQNSFSPEHNSTLTVHHRLIMPQLISKIAGEEGVSIEQYVQIRDRVLMPAFYDTLLKQQTGLSLQSAENSNLQQHIELQLDCNINPQLTQFSLDPSQQEASPKNQTNPPKSSKI